MKLVNINNKYVKNNHINNLFVITGINLYIIIIV